MLTRARARRARARSKAYSRPSTREEQSSSLLTSGDEEPPLSFWLDLLVNNQWTDGSKSQPFEWWASNFQYSIKKINHTIVVLSPWQSPISLTRSWCLWELHCTIAQDCILEFVMQESETASLRNEFIQKGCEYVIGHMSKIDVQSSRCKSEDDKRLIDEAIELSTGYSEIQIEI